MCPITPGLPDAGHQTQGSPHTRQAVYQLCYVPSTTLSETEHTELFLASGPFARYLIISQVPAYLSPFPAADSMQSLSRFLYSFLASSEVMTHSRTS